MYLNNNGMYQGYSYMASPMAQGTHAFPQLMRTPYYHPQQFRQQNQYAGQYNNNNWVGQDMHHQKAQHPGFYYQGPQFYQQQPHAGNDENSYPSPRPLQPPRAGKKNRKPSESQEKKNKSPTKGYSSDTDSKYLQESFRNAYWQERYSRKEPEKVERVERLATLDFAPITSHLIAN